MKSSPLQLKYYFVTGLTLTANKNFNPQKEVDLQFADIEATPSFLMEGDNARQWQVTLLIKYGPVRPDVNVLYNFTVDIAGFFEVASDYPADKVEWLVKTNATSVLFSAAREIIRAVTSLGPYSQLILPTASFIDLGAPAAPAESPGKSAAVKPPKDASE